MAGSLKPNDVTDDSPSWAWTAGGAISTADDLTVYVKGMVDGALLNSDLQKQRLDCLRPANPSDPSSASYGLGLAQFGPMLGHDGQLPGFMSFMGHDPDRDLTLIVLTNLSAVPEGEGAALPIAKAIIAQLYSPGEETTPTTSR